MTIALSEAPMLRAQVRAENADPGFTRRASLCILALLQERGPMPGELLVDLCRLRGIVPADGRAFGAPFRMLSQAGRIRVVGHCQRRRGHGTSGGLIWAAT